MDHQSKGPVPSPESGFDPRARSFLTAASMFLFSLAAGAQITWQELSAFQRDEIWSEVGAAPHVLASLFCEAYLPVALFLAVALLLASRGATRAAWAVLIGGAAAFAGWVGIDFRVIAVTGNHLHTYLRYATGPAPFDWAGGTSETLRPLFSAGARPALLAALAGLGLAFASRALCRRGCGAGRPFPTVPWLAGIAAACAVPLGLAGSDSRSLPLLHLNERFLYRIPFLPSVESGSVGGSSFLSEFNGAARERLDARTALHARPPAWALPALPPGPRPHVVVVVLESLRADSIDPRWMPRLARWAEGGLRLERHSSSGNVSQLGLFSLLYGLNAMRYAAALNARGPAMLPGVLRSAGYRTVLLDDSAVAWQRMEEFLSERNFDELLVDADGTWPERDARTIARIPGLVANGSRPVFAFAYLMSTHFDYPSPASYQRFLPAATGGVFSFGPLKVAGRRGEVVQEEWRNRYRNTLAFLDDRLGEMVEALDPARTIVVITGDHGESFGEDGLWLHGGRLSDQQTLTPLVLVGAGIPRGTLAAPTIHADLLPTLLHAVAGRPVEVPGTYGYDLLAPTGPPEGRPLLLVNHDRKHLQVRWRGERLHLLLSPRTPRIASYGFQDARGAFLPRLSSAIPASGWADCVEGELERIGR